MLFTAGVTYKTPLFKIVVDPVGFDNYNLTSAFIYIVVGLAEFDMIVPKWTLFAVISMLLFAVASIFE